MVALQIITVIMVLLLFLYLVNLLLFDLFLLVINAVILYLVLARMLTAFEEGLNRIYVAVGLVVLLSMVVFRFPSVPIYLITWFVALTHLCAQAAAWAHRKRYIDLSDLMEHPNKKR